MCLACAAAALASPGVEAGAVFGGLMALGQTEGGQPPDQQQQGHQAVLQVLLLTALAEELDST